MSTDLDIFSQSTSVAHAKRDDGFTNKITAATITSKSISIINNKFRLMVNGKEISRSDQGFLDVVVLNVGELNRMYYDEQYDPKAIKKPRPACWSHNSDIPDMASPKRQSDKCMTCPQNIAGSGQGKSKACRFHRFIAVVRADDMQGDIYRVKLSSTSIFGTGSDNRRPFHEYRDYVVANNETLGSVVSRMSVNEDGTSNIGFKAVARLSDDQFEMVKNRSSEEEVIRAITLTVAADRDEEGNEFESRPRTQQPINRPQPEVVNKTTVHVDIPVDNIPEPEVRKDAPKATPKSDTSEPSLDDLLSDWT